MKKYIILALNIVEILLKLLAVIIHLWTTVIAYNWSDSILIAVLTFFLPVLAELGWIVILWMKTGIFLTPFAIVILSFLAAYLLISRTLNVIEWKAKGHSFSLLWWRFRLWLSTRW